MAGQRLTDKVLTVSTSSDDLYMIVDVSDSTGSAEGTSKRIIAQNIIQTDTVSLNMDLATNPATLIAAPGAGYIIQPLVITLIYSYNTTQSTTAGYMYIGYDPTDIGEYLCQQRDLAKNDTSDRTYQMGAQKNTNADGTYQGSIDDKALKIYGMDLGGDGALKAYVTYQIYKL